MSNAKILIIKTGLVEILTFSDGSSYESAIRKKPVSDGETFTRWVQKVTMSA